MLEVALGVGVRPPLRRRAALPAASLLVVVTVLAATCGLAVVGTLYGGLAAGRPGRETLLPLLLLPVVAPVLIGADTGVRGGARHRRTGDAAKAGRGSACSACSPPPSALGLARLRAADGGLSATSDAGGRPATGRPAPARRATGRRLRPRRPSGAPARRPVSSGCSRSSASLLLSRPVLLAARRRSRATACGSMYIHVPTAWLAYLAFVVTALASPCTSGSAPAADLGPHRRRLGRGRRAVHGLTLVTGSLWGRIFRGASTGCGTPASPRRRSCS